MRPRLLRLTAVVIAIAGLVDPAFTRERTARPVVALIQTSGAAEDWAGVRAMAARSLTLVDVAAADAAATLVLGNLPPAGPVAAPAFAITSAPAAGADVAIAAIDVPATAPLASRVPVTVRLRLASASGRRVEAGVWVDGVQVDRLVQPVVAGDGWMQMPLSFVPVAEGLARVRVSARFEDAPAAGASAVDALVHITRERWDVLAFDKRPSWMATFIRRALEDDPRFTVASRVSTSRAVSSGTTLAPAALVDEAALAPFSAVIVGGVEDLSATDVAALDAYLRRRGGAVVLALDAREVRSVAALTAVGTWLDRTLPSPVPITDMTGARVRAGELLWPAMLPPAAHAAGNAVLAPPAPAPASASAPAPASAPASGVPAVWQRPVGAGRLIVNGALDAWRYRRAAETEFDAFWRGLVATAAAASPPPVAVQLETRLLAPGASTRARVSVRDVALAWPPPASTLTVTATLTGRGGTAPVRLWPDRLPGEMTGTIVAPADAGEYVLAVQVGEQVARTSFVVSASTPDQPVPDGPAGMGTWAAAHGGVARPASAAAEVVSALTGAVTPARAPETWHPMRSPWWIVPFAASLGGEWWVRRRRGRK